MEVLDEDGRFLMAAPEDEARKQKLPFAVLCLLATVWNRRALVRLDENGLAGFTVTVPRRPGAPSEETLVDAAPEILGEAFSLAFQGVCPPRAAGGCWLFCYTAEVPKAAVDALTDGRFSLVSPEWLLAAAGDAAEGAAFEGANQAVAEGSLFAESIIQGAAPDLARALAGGFLKLPSERSRAPRGSRR